MDIPFPTDIADFDGDERISFSKLDNKFLAVHDDGTEYEFDAQAKRWILTEDEPAEGESDDAVQNQAPSNGRPNIEDTPKSRPNKKRKAPPQPRQNTAVYVTGLPLDATVTEVHELFSRKAGVIAEEIDSGKPRIKLYTDEAGNFKGDALIVFFKPQSVEMAMMLLDDTDFRITSSGTREGRIRVQVADSSYKKMTYDEQPQQQQQQAGGDGGVAKRQKNDRDRQKIIKKTQKLDAKLADWDDDDEVYPALAQPSKKDKTVILRHMFTLEELEEDPAALLEIKEDIRNECAKLGTVTSVVLYDEEPDGVVAVRFQEAATAAACIQLMHGRSFDGRVVEASLKTGRDKYRKSDKDAVVDSDSE